MKGDERYRSKCGMDQSRVQSKQKRACRDGGTRDLLTRLRVETITTISEAERVTQGKKADGQSGTGNAVTRRPPQRCCRPPRQACAEYEAELASCCSCSTRARNDDGDGPWHSPAGRRSRRLRTRAPPPCCSCGRTPPLGAGRRDLSKGCLRGISTTVSHTTRCAASTAPRLAVLAAQPKSLEATRRVLHECVLDL